MNKKASVKKNQKGKITISKIDHSALCDEAMMFGPDMCLDCNYDRDFKVQHFLVSPDVETDNDYRELKRIVKEELGHSTFAQMSCHLGLVIFVSRCPKCGSENIADDCD